MAAGDISKALKADVRSRVAEPSEQGILDTEIYGALNEAQRELLNQLNDIALTPVMEEGPLSITADENPYAFPSDLQRLRGVKYKTVETKPWPVRHLGALSNNVLHTPSETNVYLVQWSQAAPNAGNIFLRAGSKTAAGGNEIVVRYLETPAVMSDSVDPSLQGGQYYGLMVTHAVMRLREKQDFDEAERLWQEFQEGVAIINSRSRPVPAYDGKPSDRGVS